MDSTGVEFLQSYLGGTNTKDFTIVDSGVVINGQATQLLGGNGCNTVVLNSTAGCPGNPSQYCYADIRFKPVAYGTPLTANITFGT